MKGRGGKNLEHLTMCQHMPAGGNLNVHEIDLLKKLKPFKVMSIVKYFNRDLFRSSFVSYKIPLVVLENSQTTLLYYKPFYPPSTPSNFHFPGGSVF